MELDLQQFDIPTPELPTGYRFVAWTDSDLDKHASIKHESFCNEIDANVFSCFREFEGCQLLLREITSRSNFLPDATWMLEYKSPDSEYPVSVGTIQALVDVQQRGAIQNIGIHPQHRDKGLGSSLLFKCLTFIKARGIQRVMLEVTSQNVGALRLYERLGFRIIKTVYKPAPITTY
tara:strand:- start:172 stop:702 length:531 start_codon:yes stop_codon:yes gene_type:complete